MIGLLGKVSVGTWRKVIRDTEERLIRKAMEVRKEAARRLGMSYPTFLKKLREHGLENLKKEKK